ncbi:MAG: hypothetical protein MUE41_09890 [Gemmatimonadaceae bacterium]|nr:hypothetical protein [Gemmatimonadaceae bacterium]
MMLGGAIIGATPAVHAQAAEGSIRTIGAPRWSLLVGAGNDMGSIGAAVEIYAPKPQWSLFLGAGHQPPVDSFAQGFVAGGGRWSVGGQRHRALVTLGWMPLVCAYCFSSRHRWLSGTAAMAGYRYLGRSGITAHVGAGWGIVRVPQALRFEPGTTYEGTAAAQLAVGYTWRRTVRPR